MDRDYDYEDAWYDILDEPAHQVLVMLAKRNNPDVIDEWNMVHAGDAFTNAYYVRCLICGKKFPNVPGIMRHGMKHLKDSNLLAFV